jgi:ankyrin repeat protein
MAEFEQGSLGPIFDAARRGDAAAVASLLAQGVDPNIREPGDNTYPMHWAAAAGHAGIVRMLADAGGDVIGAGDDHQLEVIGWASCWQGCDDEAHRDVIQVLLERGAKHNIFSAIATGSADEVRRIARDEPSRLSQRMSHNEGFQRPLHFAVRMNRPAMVALLLELGADPALTDESGFTASAYATARDADRPLLEFQRDRGRADIVAAVGLGEWDLAENLLRASPGSADVTGVLHLMAKRGNVEGVNWLLDRGAEVNARWDHMGAVVTPLHLAALHGHAEVVSALLARGADKSIHDSLHESDARGWAEASGQREVMEMLA